MRRIFTLLSISLLVNQAVSAQCNPGFTFTVNQNIVSFTGTASGPGIFHYWNFGDGYYGFGQLINHPYNNPGTYPVKLMVYDSLNSCMDSLVQTVTLNFSATCQASFYVQYDSLEYSNGIDCYSNSTYSGTGIQQFAWKVNGVPQGGNNAYFHLNRTPGVHNICLTITTQAGCTSTYCRSFTIPAFCNTGLSFSYTADPVNPRRISFTPSPNQANYTYRWQFGDGTSSVLPAPVHTYTNPGIYSVKLSLRDTLTQCIDTIRQTINVSAYQPCTTSFTYTLSNTGMGVFTASSNQPIVSQNWYIYRYATGDSVMIQASNPAYQFPDTGTYLVCLSVITNTGCVTYSCQNIYVPTIAGRNEPLIPAYPNPVNSGEVRMNLVTGAAGPLKISVFDMTGNIVYRAEQAGQAGANILRIPVERLNRGQYFVEICYAYKIKRSIFQKL